MMLIVFLLAAALPAISRAQQETCLQCHPALAKKKIVHAAQSAGCSVCHSTLDVSTIPHRVSGRLAKGLAADQPDLCMKCHDARRFTGKFLHAPVLAGRCTLCHEAHASNYAKLLRMAPVALCFECHAIVKKSPHVIGGFWSHGHPLGYERWGKFVADPLRPGNAFYCGSCHEPHGADFARLLRFDTQGERYCQKCHKF